MQLIQVRQIAVRLRVSEYSTLPGADPMLFGKHPNGAGAKTRLLATGHYFSLLHVLGIAGCISRSKWPQLVAQTMQTSTLSVADALFLKLPLLPTTQEASLRLPATLKRRKHCATWVPLKPKAQAYGSHGECQLCSSSGACSQCPPLLNRCKLLSTVN